MHADHVEVSWDASSPAGCSGLKPARKSYGDTVLYRRTLMNRHYAGPLKKPSPTKVTNWIRRAWSADKHGSP